MITTQYYLNRNECTPQIPTRYNDYLDKKKYLSEFQTKYDKEIARTNLGINEIIEQLNNKIDNKVIERGGVPWDLVPTEGHDEYVISSNALYNLLLNYVLTSQLDSKTQELWTNVLRKIKETYDQVELELNQLNESLQQCINSLDCKYNQFITTINQEINNFTQEVINNFNTLQNSVNNLNSEFQLLKNYVNNQYNSLYTLLYNNLSKDKIVPLENRMRSIEIQMKTFLKSVAGGTALTDQFGDSDDIGVTQSTLTDAINKIWQKINELSGDYCQGINMIVTPQYFIGENGCNVHITAVSANTGGIFEHIELYMNGEKFYEADNIEYLETDTYIDETSVIMCKAKILGIEYSDSKTITHYNSFWIGAGITYEQIMTIDYVRPVNKRMRNNYNIDFSDNDYLFIILGSSLDQNFTRADMNGVEIPFDRTEITVDNESYVVYKSKNKYRQGTYNIDINS